MPFQVGVWVLQTKKEHSNKKKSIESLFFIKDRECSNKLKVHRSFLGEIIRNINKKIFSNFIKFLINSTINNLKVKCQFTIFKITNVHNLLSLFIIKGLIFSQNNKYLLGL